MRMNKRELSELLGVSETTLTEWQRQGMPIAKAGGRGKSGEYDPMFVVNWIEKTGYGLGMRGAGPRVDLDRVKTKIKTLVPAPDFSDIPDADFAIARAILEGRARWMHEMPAWEYPMSDQEAAEYSGQILAYIMFSLRRAQYNAIARILDESESEAAWPDDLEEILARVDACVPAPRVLADDATHASTWRENGQAG